MKFKPRKKDSITSDECQESVETLLQYRRKGIPLMQHQKDYLNQHGYHAENPQT